MEDNYDNPLGFWLLVDESKPNQDQSNQLLDAPITDAPTYDPDNGAAIHDIGLHIQVEGADIDSQPIQQDLNASLHHTTSGECLIRLETSVC